MATYSLNVPKKGLTSPSSWGSRNAVKTQLDGILTKYSGFLKFASENSKIPLEILASFIAVESGGNPTAGGSGSMTQGLMQWNRQYADNIIEAEKRMGRMTPAEEAKLKQYGFTFDKAGQTRKFTQADLVKPELNILVGSILLGQYTDGFFDGGKMRKDSAGNKINWANSNGELRIDRIIAVYNAGAYGDTGKKAIYGDYPDALSLSKAVNPITRAYIGKILGLNGAMDVATSDLSSRFRDLA
jgi:hypothetical protein